MRYSIIGAAVHEVATVGGQGIKEAPKSGVIFATLTEQQADILRSTGSQVVAVGKVATSVSPPAPVAASPIYSPQQIMEISRLEDVRGVTDPPLLGSGFYIAIIDTGIRETHNDIGGRVVYRKNYTLDPMHDGFDHGTGVASIALAVAPEVGILNMKVLSDLGLGTEEEVVLAIDDCIALLDDQSPIAPCVINLSLGSYDDGNPDNPLRISCREALARGIWINAAAGNGGPGAGSITCPACEQYVFATGSAKYIPTGPTFVVSEFSARGPTVEGITKPESIMFGEDLVVASSASDTATVAKTGTSFSAPFTSGLAILYHEGETKQVAYTEPIPGVLKHGTIGRLVTLGEFIEVYLPGACIKPQGVAAAKDNAYGNGMIFGPLIKQAMQAVPVMDISSLLSAFMMIGVMGVMSTVMRGIK